MNNEKLLTPLKRFLNFVKEEKNEIYAIYFYAVLNGLISLSLPLGIQAIFNFILGGRVSTSWVILVVIVAIGISIGGYLQINQLFLSEKLQQRIFTNAGFGFAYRLPKLNTDNLAQKSVPEMVNQFFDAVNMQKGMSKILMEFTTASIQVIFGLILLSLYHPFFILFGIILILILVMIFYFTSPKAMESALKESTSKYKVAFWLEEVGRTMATFKLAGNANLPIFKVDKLLQTYISYRNQHFGVLVFQYKILIAFKVLIVSSLLVVGSLLFINNEISLGQFVAAEIIIILVVNSVEKLILSLETVYDTLTAFEKLGRILDLPMERQEGTEKSLTPEMKGLRFDIHNLSYRSQDMGFKILDDVSFVVEPGEKIVLTGLSGSGKSTLLNLMAGLHDSYEGRININGLPLDAIDLSRYRGLIGDSFTEESIFNGTIRENITLERSIDEEHLLKIIEIVGLDKFIYQLPDGLDTLLQTEGKGLSKSTINSIIVARCLSAQPKVLLLEGLFADMLPDVKKRVLDYILNGQWSVIMISDETEILRKVPRVIELKKGQIRFDGPSDNYLKHSILND
jgi:ABC-type bacteriocin/lantibiotic exporter with double-glycine peptidase domain